MELQSMKVTKKESEQAKTVMAEAPEYPYGLCLNLDDEILGKLGIVELPKVGTTMMFVGKASVTSVSENETEGAKKHRSVSLQITDMAIDKAKEKSTEDTLYQQDTNAVQSGGTNDLLRGQYLA